MFLFLLLGGRCLNPGQLQLIYASVENKYHFTSGVRKYREETYAKPDYMHQAIVLDYGHTPLILRGHEGGVEKTY